MHCELSDAENVTFKVKQMCHRHHQRAQFSNRLLFLRICDMRLFEDVANKLKKLTH